MTTEDKAQAFQRFVQKRTDAILDALRILSNLSGPAYDWSPADVLRYFEQIDAAKVTALQRFTEQKRWATALAGPVRSDDPDAPQDAGATASYALPPEPNDGFNPDSRHRDHAYFAAKTARHNATIAESIRAASNDIETLAIQHALLIEAFHAFKHKHGS